MNKTQKIILIAAIVLVIGLVLLVAAAIAAGGSLLNLLARQELLPDWYQGRDYGYSLSYDGDKLSYNGAGRARLELSDGEYQLLALNIDQEFTSIELDNDFRDLRLLASDDDQVILRYPEGPDESYTASVNSQGVLEIKGRYSQRLLKNSFNFAGQRQYALELYLPRKWQGDIDLSSDFGDIKVNGIACDSLDIRADYGDVELADLSCGDLQLRLDYGDADLVRLSCGNVDIQQAMGGLELRDAACAAVEARLDCGDMDIKQVAAASLRAELSMGSMDVDDLRAEDAWLHLAAGDLEFDDVDARNLEISCDMGSVSGELVGSWSDYRIVSDCDLGGNNLAPRQQGERSLTVNVSMGGVNVEFEAD